MFVFNNTRFMFSAAEGLMWNGVILKRESLENELLLLLK